MAGPEAEDDDPIAEEAKRARETPAAEVSAGSSSRQEAAPDVTSTPSLGAPPHRTERPDFRSSQLDGAPDEEEEES